MSEEKNVFEQWAEFLRIGDPFDLGSFVSGIAVGGIITLVLEGVTIYFTWPYLLAFLKGMVGAEAIRGFLE